MQMIEIKHINNRIRIGDFAALMIFANYLKIIENAKPLFFNLRSTFKYIDKSLNIKILFKNVIDYFIEYDEDCIGLPDALCRNSGVVWLTVPYLVGKYGHQIIPELNFDESLYTGPILDWKNYICFSPLFDGAYNSNRSMSVEFCNNLINSLYLKFQNKFIVITDQPDKIKNKNVKIITDSNLYNLIYIISNSKIFIGGDTGFTHFAGLGRPRGLISIYEDDPFRNFNHQKHNLSRWNSDPNVDCSKTVHLYLNMVNHSLLNFNQIHHLINLIYNE